MNGDPFERFERSRGGLLIPILIFVVGAILTTFALSRLSDLVSLEQLADEPAADVEPAGNEPAIERELDDAIGPTIDRAIESDLSNENQEPSR